MSAAADATNLEPGDEQLAEDALRGEDEAFAELVRRHKRKIFGIAARFTHNDYELDDLCQDIFIRVYRNLSKFRGDAPFEHWLSRIAVRRCYDFLRRQRRERQHLSLDDSMLQMRDAAADANVSAQRAREILGFALAQLSAPERLVITLLELEEKSVRDVAALTGWSEGNVKVRAFRARASLRRILEASGER